jgi:hypothetical protein
MTLRRGLVIRGATGAFSPRWDVGAPPGGLKLCITIPLTPFEIRRETLH